MTFAELGLAEPLLKAVAAEGYTVPTPIQAQAIPYVLKDQDLIGSAQTGTGKTAAFALPILNRLLAKPSAGQRPIRALILSPTRELASQTDACFKSLGRFTDLRHTVIFGGVNQNRQTQVLRRGVDVLTATPGRLLDLANQGYVNLRQVEVFVLDEGDQMLDMGFIHDIRKIISLLPPKRQTLLFSATMPHEIRQLASTLLETPVSVQVAPISSTTELTTQSLLYVNKSSKPALLAHLIKTMPMSRVLVFTRTKHGADRLVRHLAGHQIEAASIHGNKSQNARERIMQGFRTDHISVLVATDIAARGLDIDNVTHVVNYEIPNVPETYVHRIGRTGRAGATGVAVALCNPEERSFVRAIERLIKKPIPVMPTPEQFTGPDISGPPMPREDDNRSSRPESSNRSSGPAGNGSHYSHSHAPAHRAPAARPAQAGSRSQHPAARSGSGSYGRSARPAHFSRRAERGGR